MPRRDSPVARPCFYSGLAVQFQGKRRAFYGERGAVTWAFAGLRSHKRDPEITASALK